MMTPAYRPISHAVFFGFGAVSWMPHWACHYYRLETGSTFAVGQWSFDRQDSLLFLAMYSGLVLSNLVAIAQPAWRLVTALITGVGHCAFAALHTVRIFAPFRFEVLGYQWSLGASVREALIVGIFGLVCLGFAWWYFRKRGVG